MGNNKVQLFYPLWVKLLGIIGIPTLAAIAVWISVHQFFEEEATIIKQVFFFVIGVAVLYQCYIGSKCIGSFNTVITIYENGIDVSKKGSTNSYSWDSLLVEHYSFATTIHLKLKSGESIGYFSDSLENIGLLINAVEYKNT